MDKTYANSNDTIQHQYRVVDQFDPRSKTYRYWVVDRRGNKVTTSTDNYANAEAERDTLNDQL